MAITIAIESSLQDDVRALIAELNAALLELTPPEHCYHMTPEEMAQPNTTVFIAREGGVAVACGALKRHGKVGEIKRMYTRPSHQGRGIGGRLVAEIEKLAQTEGLEELVLETGDHLHAAWRVYERAGFRRCGPVLDYPDSGRSIFYAKPLVREAA
ncbi:MAG TPA: GNAT family N-acetyltransferase [Rhizomicrobium sp.]|nr:GNAT family N-acetyltransferase [Rhizomicrobium sp.]